MAYSGTTDARNCWLPLVVDLVNQSQSRLIVADLFFFVEFHFSGVASYLRVIVKPCVYNKAIVFGSYEQGSDR